MFLLTCVLQHIKRKVVRDLLTERNSFKDKITLDGLGQHVEPVRCLTSEASYGKSTSSNRGNRFAMFFENRLIHI